MSFTGLIVAIHATEIAKQICATMPQPRRNLQNGGTGIERQETLHSQVQREQDYDAWREADLSLDFLAGRDQDRQEGDGHHVNK